MKTLTMLQRKEVNELYDIVTINKTLFINSQDFRESLQKQYNSVVVNKVKKMLDN